ncbi:hypothetical protein IWGMT90018_38810 [Mycobacterium kiyosense]|nr:hypothetical protein IWGMT90018_38810 [Mycobacterium kiyosense]
MPGVVEQRFGENRRLTEAESGFGGALPVGIVNLVGAVHPAHAPPPPASALMMMPPSWTAKKARTSSTLAGPSVAASTGTPAVTAAPRAADLSPKHSNDSAAGPTNTNPAFAQVRANCALSLRNP